MRYLTRMALASLPALLASKAFADSCNDAICSLAGHAGSTFGTRGVLGLLATGAVALGAWLYRRRGRTDADLAPARDHEVNA